MKKLSLFTLIVLLWVATAHPADRIDDKATWQKLQGDGLSFVFGRFEGRFGGPAYRSRKIRIRSNESEREFQIDIGDGLGNFYGALPAGSYTLVAFEALYLPSIQAARIEKYPPVRQRYLVKPSPEGALPGFRLTTEVPLYLGTIRLQAGMDGMVYRGHHLVVMNDYEETMEQLGIAYPPLAESLTRVGVAPKPFFFLRPERTGAPLELIAADEPIVLARDYIAEGKYRQAIDWLMTFMPASDEERNQVRLLAGEALLGEQRYQDAIEEFGEVLLVEPENMRALRLLARAHAYHGDVGDAMNLYQALSESLPDDAEAALYLGYQYALRSDEERAAAAFDVAFKDNLDYLLYDNGPFVLALQAKGAEYIPPQARRGIIRPPEVMRSRRGASNSSGAVGVLIDHRGRIAAAHMTPNSGAWAPAMTMSVIRALFSPARLNGIPVPSITILTSGDVPREER